MNIIKEIKEGRKFQTRDGRSVRILCTNLKGIYKIAAAVDEGDKESVLTYNLNGKIYASPESNYDLVPVPTELWFNVYRTNANDVINGTRKFYSSKELAEKAAEIESITMCYLGTFSICV